MLDSLTSRLTGIFDRLRGFGRLTEENIQEALREVRVALLEADVNFKVVKAFVERVREKAVGQDVLKSLTPGPAGRQGRPRRAGRAARRLGAPPGDGAASADGHHAGRASRARARPPSAAKLARHFQKQGQHPILAAGRRLPARRDRAAHDARRRSSASRCWARPAQKPRGHLPRGARRGGRSAGSRPLILDTAGRLHIDEEMLEELRAIKQEVAPHHVLLVVDAMTGQDAVTVAEKFNAAVGIDARHPHQDGRRRPRRRGALGPRR